MRLGQNRNFMNGKKIRIVEDRETTNSDVDSKGRGSGSEATNLIENIQLSLLQYTAQM
jgi:hypothetical protein